MTGAVVTRLHASAGTMLPPGTKLLDVSIDLSGAFAHDCPPISHYGLLLREPALLRCWHVAQGDTVAPATLLASFEPGPDGAERPLRIMVAGIIPDHGWWTTPA